MTTSCPHCGWPDAEPFEVLSRHRTAAGRTVWTRCGCGSTQMWVIDDAGARIVARGAPTATVQVARAVTSAARSK